MHLRPDHAVRDFPTLHAFIQQHPLGIITTSLPSEIHPTLQCSHIPWVLDSEETTPNAQSNKESNNAEPQSLGILRGHIARQNPQAKAMVDAVLENTANRNSGTSIPGAFPTSERDLESESEPAGHTLPGEVLIVFTSPVDHYITPNFYTESKPATGKVAPTWNYAAVQVYGRATIYHDAKDANTEQFLRTQLGDLARLGEEGVMGFQDQDQDQDHSQGRADAASDTGTGAGPASATKTTTNTAKKVQVNQGLSASPETSTTEGNAASPTPWKIADAPLEYIATLLKNIIGMRVEITRIEGRFKVSQERPVNDRGGVVEGLEGMGSVRASDMALFVKRGRVIDTP
jgi:transcriptional regulator